MRFLKEPELYSNKGWLFSRLLSVATLYIAEKSYFYCKSNSLEEHPSDRFGRSMGWQLCLYLQNFFLHLRVLLIFPCPSRRKPGKQCPPISRTAFIMDKFLDERHAIELSQASLPWLRSAEDVWTKRGNVVILSKLKMSLFDHICRPNPRGKCVFKTNFFIQLHYSTKILQKQDRMTL